MSRFFFFLFFSFGVFLNANKYPNGDFFFPDRVKVIMKMEDFERKICSTNTNKSNVDYKNPKYTLFVPDTYSADDEGTEIYSMHPNVFLFNFDRVEVYGDDYMYSGDPTKPNYCFQGSTGDLSLELQKVMKDSLSRSEGCYDWAEEQVGGQPVLCGTAAITKKVLWVPKPIEEAEALVREYCGSGVNINPDLIDEIKARDCVMALDYKTLVGISETSPNKFEF